MVMCPLAYAQVPNDFVFKNMDLEGFDQKIHRLPFEFKFSDLNELIFVAPDPYLCGFVINLFEEEKTGRLILEFSQGTGFQEHINFWKNRMNKYFLLWDSD